MNTTAESELAICSWCPEPARGSAWHNDGKLHPSCGQPDHGQGWVPDASRPRAEARAIAEAFRTYAAERYEAALEHPELDWLKQPGSMARHYKKVADDLRAQADRVEAAAEVSTDE